MESWIHLRFSYNFLEPLTKKCIVMKVIRLWEIWLWYLFYKYDILEYGHCLCALEVLDW